MAVLLGAWVGNAANLLPPLEGFLGKPVDSVLAFTGEQGDWGDVEPFWQLGGGWVGSMGRKINWSIPMFPNKYGVQALRDGRDGKFDARWDSWADAVLANRSNDSGPIYVRSNWELGGEWFGWTGFANNDRTAFVACFKRFCQRFKAKSPRFKMVFDYVPDRGDWMWAWPGDDVIDVVSQDVYWHVNYDTDNPTNAWNRKYSVLPFGLKQVVQWAKDHGNKPIAISELGVRGDGYDGATYFKLVESFIKNENVVYVDYWAGTAAYNGLLHDGSPAATAAEFKRIWTSSIAGGENPGGEVTPPPTPDPGGEPSQVYVGQGSDSVVLKISQDYYKASAQYTVSVDGTQVGGTQQASARKGKGTDTVTVRGNWTAGPHRVSVKFLNDDWGGTPQTDRNLYVEGASYKGTALPITGGELKSNGTTWTGTFNVADSAPNPQPDNSALSVARVAAFLHAVADDIASGDVKIP